MAGRVYAVTCSFPNCGRPVVITKRIGQFEISHCAAHEIWLEVLADPKYRSEPCPTVDEAVSMAQTVGVQVPML